MNLKVEFGQSVSHYDVVSIKLVDNYTNSGTCFNGIISAPEAVVTLSINKVEDYHVLLNMINYGSRVDMHVYDGNCTIDFLNSSIKEISVVDINLGKIAPFSYTIEMTVCFDWYKISEETSIRRIRIDKLREIFGDEIFLSPEK